MGPDGRPGRWVPSHMAPVEHEGAIVTWPTFDNSGVSLYGMLGPRAAIWAHPCTRALPVNTEARISCVDFDFVLKDPTWL